MYAASPAAPFLNRNVSCLGWSLVSSSGGSIIYDRLVLMTIHCQDGTSPAIPCLGRPSHPAPSNAAPFSYHQPPSPGWRKIASRRTI